MDLATEKILQQITLAPDNTMDRLAWRAPNGAYREALGSFFWCTIITCRDASLDNLNLSIEACGATLNKRSIRSKAHLVDVSTSIQVIQSIEDHSEFLEPIYIELRIFDIGMVSLKLHIRIELLRRFLSNLNSICQLRFLYCSLK
jgi:hypothetical protein